MTQFIACKKIAQTSKTCNLAFFRHAFKSRYTVTSRPPPLLTAKCQVHKTGRCPPCSDLGEVVIIFCVVSLNISRLKQGKQIHVIHKKGKGVKGLGHWYHDCNNNSAKQTSLPLGSGNSYNWGYPLGRWSCWDSNLEPRLQKIVSSS